MYVIREVLNCKPGKVRQMVEEFRQISLALKEMGHEPMRLLTDVTGGPYWTVGAVAQVEKIDDFFAMEQILAANEMLRKTMADYHDLVASGRREIYRIESERPSSCERAKGGCDARARMDAHANEHSRTRGHHRTDLVHHVGDPARVASSLATYIMLTGIAILLLFVVVGFFAIDDGEPLHPWAGLLQRVLCAVWFWCLIVLARRLRTVNGHNLWYGPLKL